MTTYPRGAVVRTPHSKRVDLNVVPGWPNHRTARLAHADCPPGSVDRRPSAESRFVVRRPGSTRCASSAPDYDPLGPTARLDQLIHGSMDAGDDKSRTNGLPVPPLGAAAKPLTSAFALFLSCRRGDLDHNPTVPSPRTLPPCDVNLENRDGGEETTLHNDGDKPNSGTRPHSLPDSAQSFVNTHGWNSSAGDTSNFGTRCRHLDREEQLELAPG